jgi:hypothetical protein
VVVTINKLFEFDPENLTVKDRLIVVGDIHGDLTSLQKIIEIFNPKIDYLIFLGDYADRGPNGMEVIATIKNLTKRFPKRIITLKGNHEDFTPEGAPKFIPCTLIEETMAKRIRWQDYFKVELKPFINRLFLSAIVPGEILFLHGGISPNIRNIDDLRYPSESIEKEILWSDPIGKNGTYYNPRGVGILFGNDVTKEICQRLDIKRIIRSHQPNKATLGPFLEHQDRIITLCSSIVYGQKPHILILPAKKINEAFLDLNTYTKILR